MKSRVFAGLLLIAAVMQLTVQLSVPVISQDVSVDATVSIVTVNATADLASLSQRDGMAVLIKTGSNAGLWRYSKTSTATVDDTTVLNGPGSVGRFLQITIAPGAGSLDALHDLTGKTAADLDPDTTIEFVYYDINEGTSYKVPLDELIKKGEVSTVANVAALSTATHARDNQLFQTQGYSTEGIGANLYRYDASSTATIDGGFVLPGPGGTLSFSGTTFNGAAGTGRFIAVDQTTIVPSRFGTIGAADDTNVIVRSVAALANGKTLAFDSNQTYLIDDNGVAYATLVFSGLSSVTIEGNGATVKAKNGMSADNGTNLFYFLTCDRVTIRNLIVDGNRANRSPSGEKTTYNLNFQDCDYVTLENVKSINSCIDGFYLSATDVDSPATYCTNFVLTNCVADNCWRQGMSIINAYGVNVIGGEFKNTNGTAPQAGIDIEADSTTSASGDNVNKGIHISGARFYGNAGTGVVVSGQDNAGITIESCEFYDNDGGACEIAGQTVFRGNYVHDHSACSLNALINVSASTYANGSVIANNRFSANSVAKPCIYTHQAASYIVISANMADDNDYFVVSYANHSTIINNIVSASRNTGVGFAQLLDGPVSVTGNVIDGWVGRAVYVGAEDAVISQNIIKNGATISFAAIDCASSLGTVTARENLISNATSTAGFAIRAASGTHVVFRENRISNFSQTWWSANSGTLDIEDVINVKAYGAVGDGTTDDTAALQFAFNSANGKPVYLPAGTYHITSYLYVPASSDNFRLYGDGRNSSIIDASALSLGMVALDISDSTFTHLHDFAVIGASSDSLGGHGIWGVDTGWSSGAYLPQQVILERLNIQGFTGYKTMSGVIRGGTSPTNDLVDMPAAGIMLGQALQVKIADCYIADCDFGMYLYDCFQPVIQTCGITTNTIAGVVDESNESPTYFKNDIVGNCPTKQTFTTMLATPRRGGSTCEGAGLVLLGSSGASVTSNKIKNSYIGLLTECEDPAMISHNWIRADVKLGVLSYGPAHINENNFNPSYVAPVSVTVDNTTDTITGTAHGFADGEEVFFYGATLPSGISNGTRHFVRDSTTNTFKIAATSGGSAINITTDGADVKAAICRRQIYYYMPAGGFLANIGSVRDNRFSFNGGGPFFAAIDLESGGAVLDGVVDNNSLGESYAQANETLCAYFILCVSSSRKLAITDNISQISGNVTLSLPILIGGTSVTPGPMVARNVDYDNGGTITFASTVSPTGPYEYIDESGVINRSGVTERQGTGSPEGVVTAIVGSRFHRTDGGAGSTEYVKESGTGNTGWSAL